MYDSEEGNVFVMPYDFLGEDFGFDLTVGGGLNFGGFYSHVPFCGGGVVVAHVLWGGGLLMVLYR